MADPAIFLATRPQFAENTGVTAVSLDTSVSLDWAMDALPVGMPVQGNIDPVFLLTGGKEMDWAVERIIDACRSRPHIFNLGHGVLPETEPDMFKYMVDTVKDY